MAPHSTAVLIMLADATFRLAAGAPVTNLGDAPSFPAGILAGRSELVRNSRGASSAPSPVPTQLECQGSRASWDAGWGLCTSYAPGNSNHGYCGQDSDGKTTASETCSECGECADAPAELFPPATVDTVLEVMSEIERGDTGINKLAKTFNDEDGIAAVRQDCAELAPSRNSVGTGVFNVSKMAQDRGMTIEVGVTWDASVLLANHAVGYSFVYGEAGQYACARSKSYGIDSELLGFGQVDTITLSPFGFKTVGNKFGSAPEVCLSFGWDIGAPYGIALELCFNGDDKFGGASVQSRETQEMLAKLAKEKFAEAGRRARRQAELDGDRTRRSSTRAMLEALREVGNILVPASIGIEYGVSAGLLDEAVEVGTGGAAMLIPTVTGSLSGQELLYCEPAAECTEHPMMEGWGKNTICVNGLNCQYCEREASCPWWLAKIGCFCG